jgi:hypothetical protein
MPQNLNFEIPKHGHKSGRITTHYSAAELENLIDAANKISDKKRQCQVLTLLKRSGDYEKESCAGREITAQNADGIKSVGFETHKIPTMENVEGERATG